jgi:DNA-binding beta-propeller fold protein YncE
MRRLLGSVVPVLAVALSSIPCGAADPQTRLFVLDGKAPAVHLVEANTGRVLQTAALTGQPTLLMATPDGSRLLILDRGTGKDAGDRGWASTGRSSVTFVDADTPLQVVGRVELGSGLSLDHPAVVSSDGRRVAVLCPGYQAKKAQERQPTELVVLDVATAKEVGRVALDRPPVAWFGGAIGHRVYALVPRPDPKEAPGGSASLVAVDLETGAAAGALPLDGDMTQLVPSPDGQRLYALDRGKPSGKAEKNVNGRIHVVSVEPFAPVTALDAGSGPRGAFFEESSKSLLVLSQASPAKGGDPLGQLLVVRGEKIEATVPLVASPLFLRRSPDGRLLCAVGEKALKVLALPSFASVRDVPIEGAGTNWTSDTQPGPPNDLVVTPDGSRGLVTYENSSKLLVLDLNTGAKVGSVTTGRKGAKLAKMAEVTAINAGSYFSAREAAIRSGDTMFSYDVYGIRAASTGMTLRPDGRFAYVLNSQTNDVTVVDLVGVTAVDKVAVPGRELFSLPSGRLLAVVSPTTLSLLDTTSNAVAGKWELPGLLPLLLAPDRPGVVAVSEKSVLVLDPSTGQVSGRVDSFVGNTDGLFVERRLPPKAEAPPKKPAEPAPPSKPKPTKPAGKPKPN